MKEKYKYYHPEYNPKITKMRRYKDFDSIVVVYLQYNANDFNLKPYTAISLGKIKIW
jgi:hypothetical protein